MSWLFTIEKGIVKPTIESLMISPFRELWERDTNPKKFTVLDEFAYIEFMVSVKKTNPYRGYDIAERIKRLNKDVMKHEAYEPDDLVLQGIEWLRDYQLSSSYTLRFYQSAVKAASKLEDFFNTFDMNSVNPKTGNPLYKPKEITSALIDSENVLTKLSNLDEKVQNEIFESVKNKGQKQVSKFADPSSL